METITVLTSDKIALRKVYDSSKGEAVLRGQAKSYSVSSEEVSNFNELCDIFASFDLSPLFVPTLR